MNEFIFLLVNNVAGRWSSLDFLMVFCADYLVYVMVFVVLVYVFLNYKRWRDMAVVALGSAFVARYLVAAAIRHFYYHARPYWVIVETHLLLAKETQSSFPSGTTIFVFALATGVYVYNKKAGPWFYLAACLVGFARIFAGVHWPLDVLAGAVLGILTGLASNWLFQKYKHIVGL